MRKASSSMRRQWIAWSAIISLSSILASASRDLAVRFGEARAALWALDPSYSIGLVEAPFSVCEPQQLSLSQLVEATEPSADPRLFRTRAARALNVSCYKYSVTGLVSKSVSALASVHQRSSLRHREGTRNIGMIHYAVGL